MYVTMYVVKIMTSSSNQSHLCKENPLFACIPCIIVDLIPPEDRPAQTKIQQWLCVGALVHITMASASLPEKDCQAPHLKEDSGIPFLEFDPGKEINLLRSLEKVEVSTIAVTWMSPCQIDTTQQHPSRGKYQVQNTRIRLLAVLEQICYSTLVDL